MDHRVTVLDSFMYGQTPLLECVHDENLEVVRGDARDPELLKTAPHRTPVARLDEVKAAQDLKIRWRPKE